MALSPGEMHARIIENLPEKTGHPLAHWLDILDRVSDDRKAHMAFLKSDQGLGHQTAVAVIREKTGDVPWSDPTDLEAALRDRIDPAYVALYDELRSHALTLDKVEVTPCKTYTGFKTTRQFAVLQPSKSEGLILGLAVSPSEHPALSEAKNVGSARITAKATAETGRETLKAMLTSAAKRS
ncbi:DUF5655 domain-containing protein [Litoreibacter roseus]|uniref:DUF5655 domain-containing protein n=1 Tax=Litoreibacter roseus TaxID=2601869 RepID=A0A6N6JFH9_9RHOB|nr:DUF5655 domain-containing protein [Litoreibacter roseus]GFE65101.1 hypothetical protein KIN_21750 [Litoreibacter roseus]